MRHHGEGLLRQVRDPEWVAAFKIDFRSVAMTDADRAMLDYVELLTVTPARVRQTDITSLRMVGFDDEAIVEINQITGFFAWCNRTVDGLGVQLEDFWDDPDASNV